MFTIYIYIIHTHTYIWGFSTIEKNSLLLPKTTNKKCRNEHLKKCWTHVKNQIFSERIFKISQIYLGIFQMGNMYVSSQKIFFPLFLCWVGVHCGIYTGSYNVPNILNSPPLLFSFIPTPLFLELFPQVSFLHLHTCVHIFKNLMQSWSKWNWMQGRVD
jgi:hypothetical protein